MFCVNCVKTTLEMSNILEAISDIGSIKIDQRKGKKEGRVTSHMQAHVSLWTFSMVII